MLVDLLPVIAAMAVLVALPVLALRAMGRRRSYCGHDPNQCFWCDRRCEYYHLKQVD